MTEQEQKQIMAEATLLAEGTPMEVSAHEDTSADYAARTFNTRRGVAIWFGHEIICVLDSVARWHAFKSVASIITDGSRTAAQDKYYESRWEADQKDPALRWEMSQGTYKQDTTHP